MASNLEHVFSLTGFLNDKVYTLDQKIHENLHLMPNQGWHKLVPNGILFWKTMHL